MAIWGVTLVALGEVLMHLWRGRKGAANAKPAPPPDDAEKLLNELLAQVEAAEKAKQAAGGDGANGPPP